MIAHTHSFIVRSAATGAIALTLCALSTPRAGAQATTAVSAPAAAAADTAMKDLPFSAAERAAYAGTYSGETPEGRKMTLVIAEQNGTLIGTMNGAESTRLLSQGKNVFRPEQFPDVTVSVTVQGDHATKLTMTQHGRTMEMPRVP
jgi:hypothetical protein